ncbi:MAG: hypothetical protein D6692_07145 [Planctomycetota bacterium]|nr:MAG: hypothetical protein D6692_07145 [Planctomycetota bacterium]
MMTGLLAAILLNPFVLFASGGPNTIVAQTAVFDGTNDYLELTSSGPTGLSDGKAFTLSFWVHMATSTDNGSYGLFYIKDGSGSVRLRVMRQTSNELQVIGYNAAGSVILSMTAGSGQITQSGGWVHVAMNVDLADTAHREVRINGTAVTPTWSIYINDTLDLAGTNYVYQIGAYNSGNRLNGALCEFFFDDARHADLTIFYDSGTGKPLDLGATGTGAVFYMSLAGSGDTWATNSGTGGNFTAIGALGTTTPP